MRTGIFYDWWRHFMQFHLTRKGISRQLLFLLQNFSFDFMQFFITPHTRTHLEERNMTHISHFVPFYCISSFESKRWEVRNNGWHLHIQKILSHLFWWWSKSRFCSAIFLQWKIFYLRHHRPLEIVFFFHKGLIFKYPKIKKNNHVVII